LETVIGHAHCDQPLRLYSMTDISIMRHSASWHHFQQCSWEAVLH